NDLERKRKSSISHPRRRIYKQVESSDDDLDKEDASKQGRTSDKIKLMFKDSDFDDLDDLVDEGVSTAAPMTPPTTTTVFDDEVFNMAMAQTFDKVKEDKVREKELLLKMMKTFFDYQIIIPSISFLTTCSKRQVSIVEKSTQRNIKAKRRGLLMLLCYKSLMNSNVNGFADHELAVRLTHEEQEKFTIEERATLLAEYFERRKKQLAAERAEAIRNKPPVRAQVRNMMITYLKHMGKYTHQRLKHKTLKELQKLYQKEQKLINDFKPVDSEEDEQESTESNEEAAVDYEQENEELRMWLVVVQDEDETVDPKILSVKYPIVDWKSQNLGSVDMEDIRIYKIIRADGNTSYHKTFSSMLRKFDRQDLMDLH
ncbi:hypothetical protein Tco_1098764, partial [Tanacetum coccineum]